MPRIPGTTNRQSSFLRAFHKDPRGPAAKDWPPPPRLRSWLRKPTFLAALLSLRDTHRIRSDFHLSIASSLAAQLLEDALASATTAEDAESIANCKSKIANAVIPLRLAHTRQRFAPPDPTPRKRQDPDFPDHSIPIILDFLKVLSLTDPNRPVGQLVEFYRKRLTDAQNQQDQSQLPQRPSPNPRLTYHPA